ncbi:MAG TPA: hypothetical protein VKU44_00790 [Terriglobia bacterium]|nr:hypothetical protein [Terriglobia bacterium]
MPTILQQALTKIRKVFFTEENLADPKSLYLVLHTMQQNFVAALGPLAAMPLLSGNVVQGVALVGGTPFTINHGLARAYQGLVCINTSGVAWTGFITTNPPGVTADQCITVQNPNSGTFDFLVF